MEVVTYQIIIVLSIFGVYKFFRIKAAWGVCLFWIGWTLMKVWTFSSLFFIQLGFALGSFLICKRLYRKDKKIADLESIIKQYPDETIQQIKTAIDRSEVKSINGSGHLEVLTQAIQDANESVCILSGWVTDSVVDINFVTLLKKALVRGVNIYIGFGYEDFHGDHRNSPSSERARVTLRKLYSEAKSNPTWGELAIAKFANHEKMLLQDHNFTVCGSNNWLSNRAFRNAERSIQIFDTKLTKDETKRIQNVIYYTNKKRSKNNNTKTSSWKNIIRKLPIIRIRDSA